MKKYLKMYDIVLQLGFSIFFSISTIHLYKTSLYLEHVLWNCRQSSEI